MTYHLIQKLDISFALMKEKIVAWEDEFGSLVIGKFVRLSQKRNMVIEIDCIEVLIRKQDWNIKGRMAILVSQQEIEKYSDPDKDYHGICPYIRLQNGSIWSSDKPMETKRLSIYFPNTWNLLFKEIDKAYAINN